MKNVLLLIVLFLVGCTTLNVDHFNEKDYEKVWCKFRIQEDLDTTKYQYWVSLWTIETNPIEIDYKNLNDIKRNIFMAKVPSVGVGVCLTVWNSNMMPVFVSETEFDRDLESCLWGDGTDPEIYNLKELKSFNSRKVYKYFKRRTDCQTKNQ